MHLQPELYLFAENTIGNLQGIVECVPIISDLVKRKKSFST